MNVQMNNDPEWLRRMADLEDGCEIGVGGWMVSQMPVRQIPIKDSTDQLIFLRYDLAEGRFRNILRVTAEGHEVWQVELPEGSLSDAYHHIDTWDGKLHANSWSCYHVEIDWESGKLISSTFTK
jgi:hypothetical protein